MAAALVPTKGVNIVAFSKYFWEYSNLLENYTIRIRSDFDRLFATETL
jgi:hypothetical protein